MKPLLAQMSIEQKLQGIILAVICFAVIIDYLV
jgi:hypothetical protein